MIDLLLTGVLSETALGVPVADAGVSSDALVAAGTALAGIAVGLPAGTAVTDTVGIKVITASVLINSLLPG